MSMKIQPLCMLLLFVTGLANAQNQPFDGIIIYTNSFFLPNGKSITPVFPKQMGKQARYYTTSNHYKSFLQADNMTMQVYNEENKGIYAANGVYTAGGYERVLPENTVEIVGSPLKTVEPTPITIVLEPVTVLGYACKGISISSKIGKITYYFSDQVKVSSDLLSKHNFGDWNMFMSASNGCLPLRVLVETDQYSWRVEAIRLEPRK